MLSTILDDAIRRVSGVILVGLHGLGASRTFSLVPPVFSIPRTNVLMTSLPGYYTPYYPVQICTG